LNGTRRVPYRLPEVIAAVAESRRVFVVEGEKDADALVRAGEVATSCPGGAGKWSHVADDACKVLAGAEVIIVADKDKAGRAHDAEVAASLFPVASSVVVVEATTGKDAADHLGGGHPVDAFEVVSTIVDNEPEAPLPEDTGTEQVPVKTSVATALVNLALHSYRLVATADGEPMAVRLDGPLLARPLRGSRGLRAELAAAYFHLTGKAAAASALADALAVLEGRGPRPGTRGGRPPGRPA